ncbi:MAG TPA: hypothetical protein VFT72_03775 [Opitutaceae bacterium]|nr:hypothetical protein [Opitutaceae bacterium]
MKNVLIIASILALGFLVTYAFVRNCEYAGRVALACVFLFTAIGHFVKSPEMQQMIPPWFRRRDLIVFASGIFELGLAVSLFLARSSFIAGIITMAFLVLALPLNVYSAYARVDFGGHGFGPRYLIVRIPLQLLLIGWNYWFVLRRS